MNEAEEMDKLELLYRRGHKLFEAEEKSRTAVNEFLQGDVKTRLQINCKNFADFEAAIKERISTLYLAMKK